MLYDRIFKLKQELSSITNNPVIEAFNLDECKYLDIKYSSDLFVKQKVDNCLNLLKVLKIDFSPIYRAAYEEYIEAIIYLALLGKFNTNRVKEASSNTPDYHVINTDESPFDIYVEAKSLSFLDGNQNYKASQQSGLEAQITLEGQIKSGERIGYGESIISPLSKNAMMPTIVELIEIYIDKIVNNIKRGQYSLGDTVLVLDISQLPLLGQWEESGVTIFQEDHMKSMVSGVLWHIAFGQRGSVIFQPIEFEGSSNIAGTLTKNGILVDHPYIKGMVLTSFNQSEKRNYFGFYRHEDQDAQVANFIAFFCDRYNDDKNTQAFGILQK